MIRRRHDLSGHPYEITVDRGHVSYVYIADNLYQVAKFAWRWFILGKHQ